VRVTRWSPFATSELDLSVLVGVDLTDHQVDLLWRRIDTQCVLHMPVSALC
jgi:hypothetical protein